MLNKKLFILNLILFIFISLSGEIRAQGTLKPQKPKLIVGIVVEQMRYDFIERYWDKYQSGGFKKLYKGGMVFNNARYNHLFPQRGVSHATISTGTTPSFHGIISTHWFDRKRKLPVYCVQDNKARTIGSDSHEGRRSARFLATTTVADELKLTTVGKSKTISIAFPDCASILSAGHTGKAYWFDERAGAWITNNKYESSLPQWIKAFNNEFLPDLYLTKTWETVLPIGKYTESLRDNSNYEKGFLDEYKTFPYELSRINKRMREYSLLKMTPFANTFTKDFAIKAIQNEELGKDKFTDYLMLGFSATHEIGKIFGPESVEVQDAFLRLDRDIAHLITFLDSYMGRENYLIYLTSDHGTKYTSQYLEDKNLPAGHFNQGTAVSLLKAYLRNKFGQSEWIMNYKNQQFYIDRRLLDSKNVSYEKLEKMSVELLKEFTGVANVIGASALQNTDMNKYPQSYIQNSYYFMRSGDIIMNLLPGWTENLDYRTYNSFYDYDAHVPLIWYGWKMPHKIINSKINMTDIAPTISTILNVSPPNGCTGEAIKEISKVLE